VTKQSELYTSEFFFITSNHGGKNLLVRRVEEHKEGTGSVFSSKYHLDRLVYYEIYRDVRAAIAGEKQIKGGSRSRKVDLINSSNTEWRDLGLVWDQ